MTETPGSIDISPRLRKIAELANRAPELAFTTLAHHIDIDLLRESFRRTRKDAAVGVDSTTATEYATNLDDNLQLLFDRTKAGTYRALPVRRVYIPKGDGKKLRPLGIPTFEDKVLQQAVAMLLEAVYEQDFLDFGITGNAPALAAFFRQVGASGSDGSTVAHRMRGCDGTASHGC